MKPGASVSATCILTSKQAPWWAKVVAMFVAITQCFFVGIVLFWAVQFNKEQRGDIVCDNEQCTSFGGDCYAPGDEAKTCSEGYWVKWGGLGGHPDTYTCCRYEDHFILGKNAPFDDKLGFISFMTLVNLVASFAAHSNVGTLDPYGIVSVYGGWPVE